MARTTAQVRSTRRGVLSILVLVASLAVAGCQSTAQTTQPACAGDLWQETRLYFGRDIPTGGTVDEAQWRAFLDAEVASRFPDGFTALDAAGYWRDTETKDTIREASKVLIVFHEDTRDARVKLEAVAEAYIAAFAQQAVLGASRASCVRFYSGQAG